MLLNYLITQIIFFSSLNLFCYLIYSLGEIKLNTTIKRLWNFDYLILYSNKFDYLYYLFYIQYENYVT